MKVIGGRCMHNLFSLDFTMPSDNYVKHENNKGICFVARKHISSFKCASHIYREATVACEVIGLV
jgi:hypothetical protein